MALLANCEEEQGAVLAEHADGGAEQDVRRSAMRVVKKDSRGEIVQTLQCRVHCADCEIFRSMLLPSTRRRWTPSAGVIYSLSKTGLFMRNVLRNGVYLFPRK